ncbi:hypothetical protein OPT61_g5145 [Boeremia exigua]|uniref:Uncharacterized protein n=1 Tax=Boeremia exigua TaxID=749465 RepID=A0ACC2IBJ8_9PLEO|nr:hypothetical protein OPT61_g5145 [Boeremia exigua]
MASGSRARAWPQELTTVQDGTRVAAGDSTGHLNIVDFRNVAASGQVQAQQAKAHEEAIKCVRWFQTGGQDYVATGSWDKTVKFWDLKGAPASRHPDVPGPRLQHGRQGPAAGRCHRRATHQHDQPERAHQDLQDHLGSIEGRCAIQYVEDKDTSTAHFSTAGADGTFHFWDKDAKHRLKGYPEVGGAITATAFSRNGDIFAYAVSYDWSKGYGGNTPQYPIKIKLHPVIGDEYVGLLVFFSNIPAAIPTLIEACPNFDSNIAHRATFPLDALGSVPPRGTT